MASVVFARQTSKQRLMRIDSAYSSSVLDTPPAAPCDHSGILMPSKDPLADNTFLPSPSKKELVLYERNLQGLKRLALVMDITTICNWSLAFCALSWASAVLLGAYVTDLTVWQYYDVSILLFVEGLRFGVAALLRTVGIHRLGPGIRWFLHSAGIFIPLWMGGFALLSILPTRIIRRIGNHFLPQRSLLDASHGHATSYFSSSLPYNSLSASLTIFYSFILANAFVLLLGSFISGLLYLHYVDKENYPSIHKYHDKMLLDSSGWMDAAGVDLDYAFQMQSFEYKRGRMASEVCKGYVDWTASEVCKRYVDLIKCLYMHEKGVEAVEAALGAEDVYIREAAANIVGFFAVLEETLHTNVPLCYEAGMLSKLADLVAGGYGPTSRAAACSFALLLEANREKPEMIGRLRLVQIGESKTLGDILEERYAEISTASMSVGEVLREKSHWHLNALGKLLQHQSHTPSTRRQIDCGAPMEEEMEGTDQPHELNMEQDLVSVSQRQTMDAYYASIKTVFAQDAAAHAAGFSLRYLKIGIFSLVNVALPLTLGFIVRAYLRH